MFSWAALIPLLMQYTLPGIQYIIKKVESGATVTSADLEELSRIESESAGYHLQSAAKAAGLAMTDPRVVALSELIK